MFSEEMVNNINKYATMFSDIDPSIVKDIVVSVDNEIDILTILAEINSTIDKTDKERKEEEEFNLGSKFISDMKFESTGGIAINESKTRKSSPGKKSNSFRNIFNLRKKSNSSVKFQKFD